MTLETVQGLSFDILRSSDVITATGKNIMLLPYNKDYAGVTVLNWTKSFAAATTTASPFFFKNVPAVSNNLFVKQKLLYEEATTPAVSVEVVQQIAKTGGIVLPSIEQDPIVATAITKASTAVVTASGHGLVVGQMVRIVSTNMTELIGAVVQVTDVPSSSTFEISVDSSGFTSAATAARMQIVAPGASHSYKILEDGGAPGSLILSNIEGIAIGAVLTISAGNTSLLPVDNKRAKVIAIDTATFTVTTDLDTAGLGTYTLPTTVGEISATCGLASTLPDPSIIEGDAYLGGVLLLAGATNPAGEAGDVLEIKL